MSFLLWRAPVVAFFTEGSTMNPTLPEPLKSRGGGTLADYLAVVGE